MKYCVPDHYATHAQSKEESKGGEEKKEVKDSMSSLIEHLLPS